MLAIPDGADVGQVFPDDGGRRVDVDAADDLAGLGLRRAIGFDWNADQRQGQQAEADHATGAASHDAACDHPAQNAGAVEDRGGHHQADRAFAQHNAGAD